jgi:abhydrolase domain-containing protein 17
MVKKHFDNEANMNNVKSPTFFVHGKADTLIPCAHSQALFEICKHEHKAYNFPQDMTHNDFNYDSDIIEPLVNFIKSANFETAPTDKIKTV